MSKESVRGLWPVTLVGVQRECPQRESPRRSHDWLRSRRPSTSRSWNLLRAEFNADQFRVFFNGEKMVEVEDRTFQWAGAIGLWTKADGVTLFGEVTFGSSND